MYVYIIVKLHINVIYHTIITNPSGYDNHIFLHSKHSNFL